MNAVDIDVSKEKSTIAIYQPGNQVILKLRDFDHTKSDIFISNWNYQKTEWRDERMHGTDQPVLRACRHLSLRYLYLRQCRESHPDQEVRR